ncbi:pseudouridylate synthase TRUB2, mitochondrial [Chanos chanos]|uniref:Pseudouridylate synthase TRUB2, mitochondrial n=1 Tax=Chanos chanos TaxID=29144 RepID=A0A6J2VKT3_CHACN|nr:mitochondrial mRNA pseudouridine synthase TRUB2 [Chanos chanos]
MPSVKPAVRLFRKLEGLFAVYKPPGVHWKTVRDTIETNILKAVDATPRPAPRRLVQFQAALPSGQTTESTDLTVSVSALPALSDHPLVTGPQFQKVRVGVGHCLDAFSSGVLVLGVGQGNTVLPNLYHAHVTRDYTLEGEFGTATDDFSHNGRIIERTTYDHITRDKLDRVLAMIQGTNQKALIMYSKVDPQSQEAYELAVRGRLRPQDKSPPVLIGIRCASFKPPHFTLEVQCVNETQRYLRRVLHEVGLELRSSAVCAAVRRTRDGPFRLEHALTRQHWNAADIMQAVAHYRPTTRKIKNSGFDSQSRMSTESQSPSREPAQPISFLTAGGERQRAE